jgi:hypothetical protein
MSSRKHIVKNYVVRDPNILLQNLGIDYHTHIFSPIQDEQDYFEDLVSFKKIKHTDNVEVYINGIRYHSGVDFQILENNILKWINTDWKPRTIDRIVVAWR